MNNSTEVLFYPSSGSFWIWKNNDSMILWRCSWSTIIVLEKLKKSGIQFLLKFHVKGGISFLALSWPSLSGQHFLLSVIEFDAQLFLLNAYFCLNSCTAFRILACFEKQSLDLNFKFQCNMLKYNEMYWTLFEVCFWRGSTFYGWEQENCFWWFHSQ